MPRALALRDPSRPFGRFLVSSVTAAAVDLAAFGALCAVLDGTMPSAAVILTATVAARILSSLVNYLCNYALVFHSRASRGRSAVKYGALTAAKTLCSALAVAALAALAPEAPELLFKIPVDIALFFVNYLVQKHFVY